MRPFRRRNSTSPEQPEDAYVPQRTISILESRPSGENLENLENEVSSLANDYAREGETLEAFFDDLDVLLQGAGLPEASSSMLRRAGSAWSAGILKRLDSVAGEGSLTGLSTLDGLRTAIDEVDDRVGHGVVIVELIQRGLDDTGDHARLAETLRIAMVAEELRAAFTSGELLARVSDERCVALVGDGEDLELRAARVKKAISRRLQMGPHGFVCRVWTEPVPYGDTKEWLAEVCR